MTKDGKSPLYFRLTIDGLQEEMSTGVKVAVEGWNVKLKQVTDIERDYKLHNKRLRKIETDLERLVDLVQATDQLATPAKVLAARISGGVPNFGISKFDEIKGDDWRKVRSCT